MISTERNSVCTPFSWNLDVLATSSDDEIKEVLFSSKDDKSGGLDVLSLYFY